MKADLQEDVFNCAGDRRSRARFRRTLPGAPERMRFGIEDDFAEIQSLRRGEEQIKIFKCLGQDEALHFIALLLGYDISKCRVAGIRAAIFHEIIE